MKRLFATALVCAIIMLVVAPFEAKSQCSSTIEQTDGSQSLGGAASDVGQSFTATISGTLSSVEILPRSSTTTNLTIYEGDGLTGKVLYTASSININTLNAFQKVSLSSAVSIQKNLRYTFHFSNVNIGAAVNKYTGGTMYSNGICGGSCNAFGADMAFKVEIASGISLDSNEINENSPIGTKIGTFKPAASGCTFTNFTLPSGILNNDLFTITDSILASNAVFDAGSQTSYDIRVNAKDASNQDVSFDFKVTVLDVDAPPVFNDTTFYVYENLKANTVIGTAVATEPDPTEDPINYNFIKNGSINDDVFGINSTTGEIFVINASKLNFELVKQFQIRAAVGDNVISSKNLTDTATITFIIKYTNDLHDLSAETYTLFENEEINKNIGSLVLSDDDTGQSYTYSIISGDSNNTFRLSGKDIFLNDNTLLDFETIPFWNLEIAVTDNQSPQLADTNTIRIRMTDVNERPEISDQTFNVNENTPNLTIIDTIQSIDQDNASVLTYKVLSTNDSSGVIAINATSGNLTVTNALRLDHEVIDTLTYTVELSDNGSPSLRDTAIIKVAVVDINDTPSVQRVSYRINEGLPNGTVIGSSNITDNDENQILTYSIIAGNKNNGFGIDASGNIVISNTNQVNYSNGPTVKLWIEATDNGIPSISVTNVITININDQNDKPFITDTSFVLDHRSEINTFLGQVNGGDNDLTQEVKYSILSGNDDDAFAINTFTGDIIVLNSQAVDYFVDSNRVLKILIADDASPSLSDTATVSISINAPSPSSVESLLELSFNVYPNPFTNEIKINIENASIDDYTFELFDLQGRLIISTKVNPFIGENSIETSSIPNGLYIGIIKDDKSVVLNERLIKQ